MFVLSLCYFAGIWAEVTRRNCVRRRHKLKWEEELPFFIIWSSNWFDITFGWCTIVCFMFLEQFHCLDFAEFSVIRPGSSFTVDTTELMGGVCALDGWRILRRKILDNPNYMSGLPVTLPLIKSKPGQILMATLHQLPKRNLIKPAVSGSFSVVTVHYPPLDLCNASAARERQCLSQTL